MPDHDLTSLYGNIRKFYMAATKYMLKKFTYTRHMHVTSGVRIHVFILPLIFKYIISFRTSFCHIKLLLPLDLLSDMIIQSVSVLLLVCLSLKMNNDHLNFPPKSDPGSIIHHHPLCRINRCTDEWNWINSDIVTLHLPTPTQPQSTCAATTHAQE